MNRLDFSSGKINYTSLKIYLYSLILFLSFVVIVQPTISTPHRGQECSLYPQGIYHSKSRKFRSCKSEHLREQDSFEIWKRTLDVWLGAPMQGFLIMTLLTVNKKVDAFLQLFCAALFLWLVTCANSICANNKHETFMPPRDGFTWVSQAAKCIREQEQGNLELPFLLKEYKQGVSQLNA